MVTMRVLVMGREWGEDGRGRDGRESSDGRHVGVLLASSSRSADECVSDER